LTSKAKRSKKKARPASSLILCSSLQSDAFLKPSFHLVSKRACATRYAQIDFNFNPLSKTLLGEDEGTEKRNLDCRGCERFLPQSVLAFLV